MKDDEGWAKDGWSVPPGTKRKRKHFAIKDLGEDLPRGGRREEGSREHEEVGAGAEGKGAEGKGAEGEGTEVGEVGPEVGPEVGTEVGTEEVGPKEVGTEEVCLCRWGGGGRCGGRGGAANRQRDTSARDHQFAGVFCRSKLRFGRAGNLRAVRSAGGRLREGGADADRFAADSDADAGRSLRPAARWPQ